MTDDALKFNVMGHEWLPGKDNRREVQPPFLLIIVLIFSLAS